MIGQARLVGSACLLLWLTSCGGEPGESTSSVQRTALKTAQSITYVGKRSITNFTGYGQHLQYWPMFGLTSGKTARRTDDPDCIELTPSFASFKHHYLLPGRTFSNDALGSPIGTKTRGGYPTWAMFTLPDGRTGRSGTFYDESNVDNSNNTVNEMRINVSTLNAFCLNLITDNTNHEHDADVTLEARADKVDLSLAGHPDLVFDGVTDMYTFRYEGMKEDDVVKIRFQCSSASGCKGAGLGGIMVSDLSTCTGGVGPDAGAGDAGERAPDADAPDSAARESGQTDGGASPDAAHSGDGAEEGGQDDGRAGCGCWTAGAGDGRAAAGLFLVMLAVLGRRRLH